MFTVIVPVCNKEKILESSLGELAGSLKKRFRKNWQMIIAERGSSDNSAAVCRKFSRENKGVKFVQMKDRPGLGQVFKKVAKLVKGDVIVIEPQMANNSGLIGEMVKLLKDDFSVDVINGSRFVKGAKYKSFTRKMMCRIYNLFVKLRFKSKKLDYQCGLKCFREKVFKHLCIATKTEGKLWFTEALVRAAEMEYDIVQMPVDYSYKWRINPKALFEIFREILGIRRGVKL